MFPVDAYGRVISGADITARTDGKYGESGVYLTLDLEIQQIVEDCMDECGGGHRRSCCPRPEKRGDKSLREPTSVRFKRPGEEPFRTAILRLSTALFALLR